MEGRYISLQLLAIRRDNSTRREFQLSRTATNIENGYETHHHHTHLRGTLDVHGLYR